MIRHATYAGSLTLKTVLIDDSTGAARWWNNSTPGFESYNASNVANYGLTTTRDAGADYTWTIPATLAAGTYRTITFAIAATTLAATDLTSAIYEDSFIWSGSAIVNSANAIVATLPAVPSGYATSANQATIINQTNKIGTNSADSPNQVTAQTAAEAAATLAAAAATAIAAIASGSTIVKATVAGQAGASPCTLTITANGSALSGANVWITTDSAGAQVVAGILTTNSQGKVTVPLIAGDTYYVWMTAAGENPISGQSFVAVAD